MKIQCDHCAKVYNVADEKVANKLPMTLPCPACKNMMTIPAKDDPATPPSTQKKMALLSGDALRKQMQKDKKHLPPMPQVVYKARKILANPNSSFNEIGDILEADQAIASRVLKMANSSYYGMQGKVSSIRQASVILGLKTLGELITVAGSSELLGNRLKGYDFSSGVLWKHSLAVAFCSEKIADIINPAIREDAFLAGLIHDAGKLILDKYLLENKVSVQHFLETEEKTFWAVETRLFQLDHAEVGYELCRQWNIPERQTIAIKYHHTPSECSDNQLAYILHMSDWIAMSGKLSADFHGLLNQMDESAMDRLGLTDNDITAIMDQVVAFVASVAKGMGSD
ncbi:MAG: HDOD domain-containing protein [Thermodesulfobacteriota bacterium]|nr:HDOD domain-containing protein [Thermodesulfobacteriota bacterium]